MAKGRKKDPNKKLIAGIGSALVDILLLEDEEFLASSGAQKGGMTLVENDAFIESILSKTSSKPLIVPGGSGVQHNPRRWQTRRARAIHR